MIMMSYMKMKPNQHLLKEKNLSSPPIRSLLRDYPSFDLLWYDLEGSLRVMVQDLVEPSIRRMTEYDSKIERIRFEIPKCNARIDELKKIVMETDQKLDVFEKIHLRLAELNAERKILEDHVNYEVKTLKTRMS